MLSRQFCVRAGHRVDRQVSYADVRKDALQNAIPIVGADPEDEL